MCTCTDFEILQHHHRRLQKRSSADDDVTLVMGSSSTIAATVGSNRILECEIRYPSDTKIYIEHIITWKKQGTEVLRLTILFKPLVTATTTVLQHPWTVSGTGRLKMREWKMRYGQNCRGGKCRSGKSRSKLVWKAKQKMNRVAAHILNVTRVTYRYDADAASRACLS